MTDPNQEDTSWRYLVISSFAKSGPWAVLTILLLAVVWYELDRWASDYVRSQREFISLAATTLTSQGKSLEQVAQSVLMISDYPRRNAEALEELIKRMESAHAMMAQSPIRSEKMLASLQEIEAQMKILAREFTATREALERYGRERATNPVRGDDHG